MSNKRAPKKTSASPLSRRDFLAASAIASAAAISGGCASANRKPWLGPFAHESINVTQPVRVGLIGCGGRGTGATRNCVESSEKIEIVAMGDLFKDRLDSHRAELVKNCGPAMKVIDEQCFVGFDAFKHVLACDLDLVILATPPHFRPEHLEAAIAAGKNVFMEKPVAVDPVGIRRVIAASEVAEQKGLAIVSGTQRRHDPVYVETMRRIHDGAIGELTGGQCYWNQEGLWVKPRQPGWSDMEWQCRNWLYFTWLSGDHIVEQHVHNLDVINWAMGGPPVKCVGMGGRQARTEPKYGNIFDHFAIEYEYANGVRTLSMCRQTPHASTRVSEHLVGSRGTANPHGVIDGRKQYKFEYPEGVKPVNPYVQEHADLIASIRLGKPLNEGRRVAESTLTAIMGRISAYTGREVSWNWVRNASKLDLRPAAYALGDIETPTVAIPGQTKLV